MKEIRFFERPELKEPYFIIGFAGWPDAGSVSSKSLSYLIEKLGARKFAQIDPDEFFYFPNARPVIGVEGGVIRSFNPPRIEIFFTKRVFPSPDLILLFGMEPHLKWNKFISSILQLADEFGVRRVYTIGGTYDQVPHTREPLVSALASHARLLPELQEFGLNFTTYYGPSSIHSSIIIACREKGLEAISLWGHAPYYIQQPNPRVCYSVLERLSKMIGIDIDFTDLLEEAKELERKVDRIVKGSKELQEYISKLEKWYESRGRPEETPPESEKLIREIEDFLRRREDYRNEL